MDYHHSFTVPVVISTNQSLRLTKILACFYTIVHTKYLFVLPQVYTNNTWEDQLKLHLVSIVDYFMMHMRKHSLISSKSFGTSLYL